MFFLPGKIEYNGNDNTTVNKILYKYIFFKLENQMEKRSHNINFKVGTKHGLRSKGIKDQHMKTV